MRRMTATDDVDVRHHRLRHGRRDVARRGSRRRARESSSSSAASGCVDSPEARDARAIFQRGVFRPQESWIDAAGDAVQSRQLLLRRRQHQALWRGADPLSRARTFAPIQHAEGATPGWPFDYDEFEPWYTRAEALYQVRGALGAGPDRAAPFDALSLSARAGRAGDRRRARAHGARRPASLLAAARRRHRPLARSARKTPWDAFPDTGTGKMDAETCGLKAALAHPNVTLRDRRACRAPADRRRRQARSRASNIESAARRASIAAKLVVLSAGAVNSAALLLRSARARPRQSLRHGRPPFHEPQHCRPCWRSIRARSTIRSIRRRSASTISISTTGAAGRRSATSNCSAGSPAPILKSNIKCAPEWSLALGEPPRRRLATR